ncbi:MAG: universal stress protein [Deltaproteobacteria bacterium]
MTLLPFKKFLAPVDFSNHASRALVGATELAAHFGGRLYVLHVVAPLPVMAPVDVGDFGLGAPAGSIGGLDIAAYQEQLFNGSRSALEKLVKKTVPAGIEFEVITELGDAATVIVEIAEREKIDCIVISTHGLTGLSHLLMGSVAEKVVRHAPVPVLVVRR